MPQRPARILMADDEPLFLRSISSLLRKAGYECVCVRDAHAALALLANERFDLVLSDLSMPGNLELELLHKQRSNWPEIPLIVITGMPSLPSAMESIRLGIADYLLKPVRFEDLLAAVAKALRKRTVATSEELFDAPVVLPRLLGNSPPMQDLRAVCERVARSDANVLITGESGTGKEVVARSLHQASARRQGPFQVIDCTAIPETLFESVLFGHAKGAFTSAVSDQLGLLSQADGGSVFFDEIGELPLALQAKLLRIVQEQAFTAVGKTELTKIDTRFICATNRDLRAEVAAGQFRRDLFYRLAVIHVEVPPLRERGDDVLLLADHFVQQLAPRDRRPQISDAAAALLRSYSWPGNVRELRNAIEHALAMGQAETIAPADLPGGLSSAVTNPTITPATSREAALEKAEYEYLVSLLTQQQGNVAQSARVAGLSRQGLHKLLQKHGLNAETFRPS